MLPSETPQPAFAGNVLLPGWYHAKRPYPGAGSSVHLNPGGRDQSLPRMVTVTSGWGG